MSQVSGLGGASGFSQSAAGKVNELDIDDFLKLMISELQNQDPLNPLDNSQMLQQISQIREIGATDKLNSTLNSVLLGQNVVSATALMGKHVKALDDTGGQVAGQVDRITILGGIPKLHIGDKEVKLTNVSEVTAQ